MGVSGQRHASAALYSWGKDPRYPLYRRLSGPQRLDNKSFRLCRESNPYRPVVQPIARHYTDWANRLTVRVLCSTSQTFWKYLLLPNVVVERLTLLLRIREVSGSHLGPETGYLERFVVVFLSASNRMLGYYLKNWPRQIPSKSFPIHHLLITLSFDDIQS
jgi:hypothetical protein